MGPDAERVMGPDADLRLDAVVVLRGLEVGALGSGLLDGQRSWLTDGLCRLPSSLSRGPCRQTKRDAHTFVPVGCTKPGVYKKSNLIPGKKYFLCKPGANGITEVILVRQGPRECKIEKGKSSQCAQLCTRNTYSARAQRAQPHKRKHAHGTHAQQARRHARRGKVCTLIEPCCMEEEN